MRIVEILKYARIPVKLNVKKGEKVLILTDYSVEQVVYESLAAAVYEMQAIPAVLIIPPPIAFGYEPPEIAAAAVLKTDVLIAVCSTSVTHTEMVREGLEAGVKYVTMGGVNSDMLTHGAATADYDKVNQITEQFAEILTKGERVRVTSTQGTDITFSIKERQALPLAGIFQPGRTIAGFPEGEAACAPVEETAEGLVVVDTSMHHVGRCLSPIRLTVKNGRVVRIEGKEEAERLRRVLEDRGDNNSYCIAEFAIGTNPKARCIGNPQEDKKTLGSIHIAIGDNRTLGGNIRSCTHLDGIILKPTVYVDDRMIVDGGRPAIDFKK